MTRTQSTGLTEAGGSRPPSARDTHGLIRAGLFLMVAAWLLLVTGIHALLLLLEDVMDGGSTWPEWAYAATAALALIGGAVLFTPQRWAFPVAAGCALAAGFAIFPPVTGGFAVIAVVAVVLLVVARRSAGEPEAIQLASASVPWRVKLLVVQVVLAVALTRIFLAVDFDLVWIREHAWLVIARGLPVTLLISSAAIALAIVFALLGALARLSRNPVAFGVAGFYTSFFRGTPLLVQLFLIYFGVAEVGVRMRGTPLEPFGNLITFGPLVAAIIAIGLNYGAYMTEIFRAGIQSVGHGQAEAADALGMSYPQKMRRVVLPQAVRVIIPPTGNEFIAMTKDSSLAYTITVLELFRRADLAGKQDFRSLEAFILAAGVYWVFTGILTFFQTRLERKMSAGYVRTGEAGTKRTSRKRAYLPAPGNDQPGMTFVPGGGHGSGGGGAGGALVIRGEDGTTRGTGIDGSWNDPGEEGS